MIDVVQDDWDLASAPKRIGTSGISTCIAAAVLNHSQKTAWIAHGAGWSNTARDFTEMMEDASDTALPGDVIEIWLVGACIHAGMAPGIVKQMQEDRQFVVDQAEGHELAWFATQEINPLLELL